MAALNFKINRLIGLLQTGHTPGSPSGFIESKIIVIAGNSGIGAAA